MSSSIVASFTDIAKKYGQNHVLKKVSLELRSGTFYILSGQNGSGKSTLMRLLMRHEAPNSGSGYILGVPFEKDSAGELNHKVGFVSEGIDFSIPGSLGDLVKFYSKFFPSWDTALFSKTIHECSLDLYKNFKGLSRGQRMQFCFALAISIRPTLLILDEITSVLDARIRAFAMNYLNDFKNKGGTVLLATNIVSEVHPFADQMLYLENGEIKINVPIAELSKFFTKLRKSKTAHHSVFERDYCVPVGIDSEDDSILYLIPSDAGAGLPAEIIDHRKVTADEAFIFYTRRTRTQS